MGVNRLGLVGARPFVERQEIIHAKTGGIGSDEEECIGASAKRAHLKTKQQGGKDGKSPWHCDRVEPVD